MINIRIGDDDIDDVGRCVIHNSAVADHVRVTFRLMVTRATADTDVTLKPMMLPAAMLVVVQLAGADCALVALEIVGLVPAPTIDVLVP